MVLEVWDTVLTLTNGEETNMSYETRVNSLVDEAREAAWDGYYEQERDRLLDTPQGYEELMRCLPDHYPLGFIARLREQRDRGNMDALLRLRRFTKELARSLAITHADEQMAKVAERNEDMMADWRG